MKETTERIYPLLIAGLVSAVYFKFGATHQIPDKISDVFSQAVTISSIAIGFLVTAKSILFSIQDSSILKQLKLCQKDSLLIDYMMDGVYSCAIVALYSGACLLIDFSTPEPFHYLVVGVGLALFVWSLFTTQRIVSIFAKVLRQIHSN